VALTVTITSSTESALTAYTLTFEVSGVADPLDLLTYRINGEGPVTLTPVTGAFSADVVLHEGDNTIAVRAVKGAADVTEASPVRVPDTFRGLATAEELIQLLPQSLREVE